MVEQSIMDKVFGFCIDTVPTFRRAQQPQSYINFQLARKQWVSHSDIGKDFRHAFALFMTHLLTQPCYPGKDLMNFTVRDWFTTVGKCQRVKLDCILRAATLLRLRSNRLAICNNGRNAGIKRGYLLYKGCTHDQPEQR